MLNQLAIARIKKQLFAVCSLQKKKIKKIKIFMFF